MSILDTLARALGIARPQAATPLPQITQGSQAWEDMFGPGIGNLPLPTEWTAFTVSAIYACINLIAGTISALPLHLFRVSADGEKDRILNDPLWWVLNEEMTPRWNSANGWEFMAQSLLLHGDAFAVILRGLNGMPTGIKPVHPNRVQVLLDQVRERLVYIVQPELWAGNISGGGQVYDQDDVLHIAGFGFDGLRGMSMLRYQLRMAGAVSLATQDFSAAFFANSARADYALTTDQKMSPEAIESLRAQIDERHRGPTNAHRPMVLQGGLDIKTITMPLEDMQLLATRQFQIEDIARIYGVPPFMIGHTDKTTSWGSGVEAMGTGFVRFTLRQHLNKFETEFNRKLFRTTVKRVEFDTFDLERADMKSMFDAYRVALGRAGEPGWMTTEEIRLRLNLKRQPDGTLNPGLAAPAAPGATTVTP